MTDEEHVAVLGRLEREREQAERRYVAALAALDAAAEPLPDLISSLSASDAEHARVNQIWGKYGPARGDRSAAGTLKRIVAELARLLPWRRRALHGAMIAALNRQADATRAFIETTRHFQSHVIWYAQTIAAYASTQRRGGMSAEGMDVVHAAVNSLASDWLKRWDTLQAREQRYEARMAALTKAYEDLRDLAGLTQQGTVSLKRAVDAIAAREQAPGGLVPPVAPPPAATGAVDRDALAYVVFEDRFRGSRDEIRRRLSDYLPLFAGATNVVDVGCGRGELLELFREHGVAATGIDVNDEMVEACRSLGLRAERADALDYLTALPDQSIGGLIAIQVVEHFEPAYLLRFIETAQRKLLPQAPMVLETINAACWTAFFDSYIRDFTHIRPLHPDTLRYLVQAGGFASADIQFRSPVAEHDKLPSVRLPPPPPGISIDPTIVDLVDAINAHAERLNAQLFTHRDFAIIARR